MSAPGGAEELFNARVVANRHLNDALFVLTVRCDGPHPEFVPGQFVNLGLPARHPELAGKDGLVKRPYSIASAPSEPDLEIYVRLVEDGALTPGLMALGEGDRLWVDDRCLGRFTLDSLPDEPAPHERDLVLVATGTGLAPFVSMLREHGPARRRGEGDVRWRRLALVEGVRLAEDLGYAEELAEWQRTCDWLRWIPLCSREPEGSAWAGLRGRVGAVLADDVFERLGGFPLDPASTQVMLCGNPAMIDELEAELGARGFKKHRPRDPGQLHLERYW